MKIINELTTDVHYEIRGGPLQMTMSECDLMPNEVEEWHNPDPRGGVVSCEVLVRVGDHEQQVSVASSAVVRVQPAGASWKIATG